MSLWRWDLKRFVDESVEEDRERLRLLGLAWVAPKDRAFAESDFERVPYTLIISEYPNGAI